jgi:allophanate hydrolase
MLSVNLNCIHNHPMSLRLHHLLSAYSRGLNPNAVVSAIYDRIADRGEDKVWIHIRTKDAVLKDVEKINQRKQAGEYLPLYGVPFAIKDNIDAAGLPTTAACPQFAYIPDKNATCVQKLLDSGAVLIGKTNLDQFATGLVGTRSPYGAPSCVFDNDYISGGSSSGSAVAVAAGLVSFALGTDTAGSGRVPAAFNNLTGWKPTRGMISTTGVVPACRSLDCVSVFASEPSEITLLMNVLSGYDQGDPYSRIESNCHKTIAQSFHFGIPESGQLEFFGDQAACQLFKDNIRRLMEIGGIPIEIDYRPFQQTAQLLYAGPWIAERLHALTPFIDKNPDALVPVTHQIISSARAYTAVDAFAAQYQLAELKSKTEAIWQSMDILLLPTTGTIFTHAQVADEPIKRNSDLGYYTNFVNLLDLCGIAIPGGFRSNGLPFGISLFAPAFQDRMLVDLAIRLQTEKHGNYCSKADIPIAVVGAHLRGQALNHQLTERGARYLKTTQTSPNYRLYALKETHPPKPGLVYSPNSTAHSIEVEIWELPPAAFADFIQAIPAPMTIGNVKLTDGLSVKGFLCEPFAIAEATEISHFGGWRNYLATLKP